jgi:hypothetical protein
MGWVADRLAADGCESVLAGREPRAGIGIAKPDGATLCSTANPDTVGRQIKSWPDESLDATSSRPAPSRTIYPACRFIPDLQSSPTPGPCTPIEMITAAPGSSIGGQWTRAMGRPSACDADAGVDLLSSVPAWQHRPALAEGTLVPGNVTSGSWR